MSNDFEFNSEDLEFEDFSDDPDEGLSELEEFDLDEIHTRTAILSKNNMIALLCVKTADKGGAICRVDPREEKPSVQLYDDPDKAIEWFTKSLNTSRKNGWNVVYDGLPLQG